MSWTKAMRAGELVRNGPRSSVAAGIVLVQITHTLDGSDSTPTSPQLDATTCDTAGTSRGCNMLGVVAPIRQVGTPDASASLPLKVLVSFWGLNAGTYSNVAQPGWPAKLLIRDEG